MSSEEIAIETDNSADVAVSLKEPAFFPVSLTKLVVLSICTLGIYEVYWFYKNWCFVKRREASDIIPFARAIFGYFFCYPLFCRVSDYADEMTGRKPLAGLYAIGWIVTTLLSRLPDPYWVLGFGAVLFLLPIQSVINSVNARTAPEHDRNDRFSKWNIAAVMFGGLITLLALIGTFLPPEQV